MTDAMTEYCSGSYPIEDWLPPIKIRVVSDNDPLDPRKEWDNAATMLCWHPRYNLGDERISMEDAKAIVEDARNTNVFWLPLYLYDHSGLTMKTTPFPCPWDSGQVGIIMMTRDQCDATWGVGNWKREDVLGLMCAEVEVYDKYLTGQVFGYIVEFEDDMLDSCWGYFDSEDAWHDAESSAHWYKARIESMLREPGVRESMKHWQQIKRRSLADFIESHEG